MPGVRDAKDSLPLANSPLPLPPFFFPSSPSPLLPLTLFPLLLPLAFTSASTPNPQSSFQRSGFSPLFIAKIRFKSAAIIELFPV